MGVNSGGLRCKLTSFKKVLNDLRPSVFFVKETKFKDVGKLKFDSYVVFELVRQNRDGGGLALGCDKDLQPVLVREGDDDVEALSVDIILKKLKVRCCIAYGCQENDLVARKEAFWTFLDEEVYEADHLGNGFILQFDGNLWAGPDIIPEDPRAQNKNGRLFQEFLERHPHLKVVNSLPLCQGLITRSRLRDGVLEESVLDFFIICHRILPFVEKMIIDDKKEHILTNYQAVRSGGKATNTDHYTEYMDVNLEFESEKPKRVELFDFENKESQLTFKRITSETEEFSNCFKGRQSLQVQVKMWQKVLKSHCHQAFNKIRIRKNKMKPVKSSLSKMIDKRNILKREDANALLIQNVEEDIAKEEAEENQNIIIENFKPLADNPEKTNLQQMWKLHAKLWPKNGNAPPTAKKNHKGNLISVPSEIKKLLAKEYKDRLRLRPFRPDLKQMRKRRRKIFKLKMKLAGSRKSSD